jgi:hypothetical protein
MDDARLRAERLLTLSSAARRIADLVAASDAPVNYAVMRHLLRVSEETMTEVLEEAVHARLIRRGDDAFTYVPYDDATGNEITEAMGAERRDRLRGQIASASARVFE